MPTDTQMIEIGDGPSKRPCPQIFDDMDLPQGLKVGQKFTLREEAQFVTRVYPKGTKVEFLGYVVRERTRVTLGGKVYMRHAVFRLSKTHNGILTAHDIQAI